MRTENSSNAKFFAKLLIVITITNMLVVAASRLFGDGVHAGYFIGGAAGVLITKIMMGK
jgi:hypothetical protein